MSFHGGSVYSSSDGESSTFDEKSSLYTVDSSSTVEAFSKPRQSTSPFAALRSLGQFVGDGVLLLPKWLSCKETNEEGRVSNTAYLDGMRGLAAFAVFLCHLSYGTWDITHTYGAVENGGNTSLLQLPIVRLFYSGPPMVAIFFVISGYALSIKPLKLMRSRKHHELLNAMASSVFRRSFRLLLPCFISTLIVVVLAQLGFYKLTEDFAHDMRGIYEAHLETKSDPWTQLVDWAQKSMNFINIFDWGLYAGANDLDPHLWTIPAEFRCSMALFLTHILVSRMSPKVRMSTITFLITWGLYWDRWDLIPFWMGCVIAEIDMNRTAAAQVSLPTEKDDDSQCISQERCVSIRSAWHKAYFLGVFVLGLFLASYPDADGHASPGYITLTKMIPQRFSQKHRFWPTIGAGMIIWSTGHLEVMRNIFHRPLPQYLGKISFPLYVCHGFVIHTFGYMTMDRIWEYTGYEDPKKFAIGYTIAACFTIIATVWTSDLFLRTVDVRCVKFARWMEQKLFET